MTLPGWITSIFAHSIGEITDGLWRTATAENKAGDFGRGWGDEHQLQELLNKLKAEHRPIWMDFVRWNYLDRRGSATRVNARRQLKQLRLFLTSWDSLTESGTKTTNTEQKGEKDLTTKVQLVEKIFKPPTEHALGFVACCVEIILEAEKFELERLKAEMAIQQAKVNKKTPGKWLLAITDVGLKHCREAGYRELVNYFEAAQLPVMPAPGDQHLTKSVDDWIETKLGVNNNPNEIAKASLIWLGQSSTARKARHKGRMKWVWSRFYRWPLFPFIFVYNLYT